MSIIIFTIKHPHHSGRNVTCVRSVSDRIDGGARAFVCGRSGGSARLVRFSRQHICCTDVGGDGSGEYFSAATGRLRHVVTL